MSTDTNLMQVEMVKRYFDGCSFADVDIMLETLHRDAVHWFLEPNRGSRPIYGGRDIAEYWVRIQRMIQAHWIVDNGISRGDQAVVEWAMFWKETPESDRIVTRGSEWYRFHDGKIIEIRSYHQQLSRDTGLRDWPYVASDYAAHGAEHSAVHAGIPAYNGMAST